MICGKRHFCRHVPWIVNHHGLHRTLLHPDGVYLPFEFTREYGVESLHKAFALAQKYQRMVDVHCDEIDDEQSRFVETVAALAHRENMGARVTASHTTAMHSYNGAYTSRLFRLLTLSGINFVANPLVHIHLQGRFDSYPKRRGITRVKEMPVRYSIRHGRVIAETQPALSQIHLESSEQVDFRR